MHFIKKMLRLYNRWFERFYQKYTFLYVFDMIYKKLSTKKTPTDCSEGVAMVVALSMGFSRYYSHSIILNPLMDIDLQLLLSAWVTSFRVIF